MRYLIDGHNVIAQMPDIDLADPDDEVQLVLRLRSWSAAGRKRLITVIFDGGLPGGTDYKLSTSNVKVVFASSGQTADDLLIRRVEAAKNPAEYTLVSSDQEVLASAKLRRMPYMKSQKFAGMLAQIRPAPPPSEPAPEIQLDDAEIQEWLELFGPEPELPKREAKPARKEAPPETREAKPQRRSPSELKRSDSRLSKSEVDEWLELFGGK